METSLRDRAEKFFLVEVIRSIITNHHDWLDVTDCVKGCTYKGSPVESAVLRSFVYKGKEARLDIENGISTYEFEGTLAECMAQLKNIQDKKELYHARKYQTTFLHLQEI